MRSSSIGIGATPLKTDTDTVQQRRDIIKVALCNAEFAFFEELKSFEQVKRPRALMAWRIDQPIYGRFLPSRGLMAHEEW
jgi:hypothetical protein